MSQPHQSVSSSVYSPLDSEFKFRVSHQPDPIKEHTRSRFDHGDSFGSDIEESDQDSAHSDFKNIKTDPSSQTFNSFMTANQSVPSFTSINNSLLKTESRDEQTYPDDQTPRIDSSAAYDDIDKTPLIGSWPEDQTASQSEASKLIHHELQGNPILSNDSGIDHHQENDTSELVSKFHRLSMTLLQNGSKVSEESHQFQMNFSSNVQRVNSATDRPGMTRTSTYYMKINADPREDELFLDSGRKFSSPSIAESNSADNSYESGNYTNEIRNDNIDFSKPMDYSEGGLNITMGDQTGLTHDGQFDAQSANTASGEHEGVNFRYSVASSGEIHDIDMSVLFIKAFHSFDATESQLESYNSVCLSFKSGDLAFVHTIDDSGWGEVTLLETLDRGWIPMNFFVVAVNGPTSSEGEDSSDGLQYAHYMGPLLDSCGKFLSNPISHTTRHGKKTFSIKIINSVRDGVRRLLQETDCLSRSNEIVIKKPVVRKCRKLLLSDWYNLMLKAAEYRGTTNFDKIEILTLLVLQVIRRATAFFDIWVKESREVIKRDTENSLRSDMEKYPLLSNPPHAKQRVAEINSLIYSYLSLIIGRLDLVEHNPAGCDLLETIVHHIILLLRELLFISKSGSEFASEKPPELDTSLDTLLSLVSQIVTGVKALVINTLNETDRHRSTTFGPNDNEIYSYTEEGKALMGIAAKMIDAVSTTISCIQKSFETIGDYKLSSERAYPDYSKIRVSPEAFIKTCSVGMVKSLSLQARDLQEMKQNNVKATNRYSVFRSGKSGDLGITPNGVDSLHKAVLIDTDGSAPFNSGIKEFKQYLTSDETNESDSSFTIQDELLVDAHGNLLGASFKGLVYTLTNESSAPEYFFVSAFFICFHNFASSLDLAESLIRRFEFEDSIAKPRDASAGVKLKNRQRLVCKMFQIWMESYWNDETDRVHLNTLINFFNEGICSALPFEAMKLIEVGAKLVNKSGTDQLVNRSISLAKLTRSNSFLSSRDSETFNSRYSMIDGYELTKINTNSSVSSSLKSMTLPLPLGVSGQTTSTSSLLTKNQLQTIETLVKTYRSILGENWCSKVLVDSTQFVIMDTATLLPKWFSLNDQNWVLSNYRPNLLDFNGLEIAKQFTLIESEIFCSIKPGELMNGNFTPKKAHLNLAKNVRLSLLFTNCLSEYVVESVLQTKISHKVRVNIMKTWLKIAVSCLYLRNFNSLAAIITSLQSHLITRLRKLWGDLSDKYTELYEYLCGIIHPEKNYSVYRTKLKSFLLSNDYNIPVVPYFSLFLQDLIFVTDGNPNYRIANTFLKQKLINIDKYLKITRIIADIETLQIPYTKGGSNRMTRSGTLFSLGPTMKREQQAFNSLEDYSIASVPALKELILLELWKVSQVNKKEEDRAWKLSCEVQPRDTPQVNGYSASLKA